MIKRIVVIIIFAVAANGISYGQRVEEAENPISTPDIKSIPGYRSPQKAMWFSILGTTVPIAGGAILAAKKHEEPGTALIVWGAIIGPAHGYFYGHESVEGLKGIAMRTGLLAFSVAIFSINPDAFEEEDDSIIPIQLLGPIGYLYYTYTDISNVQDKIEDHNEELPVSKVSVGPAYFPKSKALGAVICWRF
jgi:hypothetical protein